MNQGARREAGDGAANSGQPDVLIIGAGAAGAVAAKRLAESGFSVVCLEQGGAVDPATFPGDKPESDLLRQKQWHADPNIRNLPWDYPIETSTSDIAPLMYSGVGGSTIIFGGHWMRFLPSDFRVRSLDGVADDWPFAYEDLEPYYSQAEMEMAVSGLEGDPAYPPGYAPPLAPVPFGKVGRKAAEGMDALGWHWWPGTNAIATRSFGNLRPCVRRGTCWYGCAEKAKASVDLTHWPAAIENGARLVTGARVRELTVDRKGLVTGATYYDGQGGERFQPAKTVMLAANGIGTPRILLLSKSERFPNGLANSSGLVGKRLMMHPYAGVHGVFEENLESWLGPWGQCIYSLQFYETDEERGFVRGAKWAAMPTGGPLMLLAGYNGQLPSDVWGESIHSMMNAQLGHTIEWGIIAEDLPDEANQVTIDDQLTDSHGIPSPKVTYRVSENAKQMMDFNAARAVEALEAAGAVKTSTAINVRETGWHLLGTARMGTDRGDSVVNEWGRAHDVPNLFILDGSTFVTSSGLNPTATICAVALRAVEHAMAERKNQEVPA
jgi:choline dehydrogenase-like flavoprotein